MIDFTLDKVRKLLNLISVTKASEFKEETAAASSVLSRSDPTTMHHPGRPWRDRAEVCFHEVFIDSATSPCMS